MKKAKPKQHLESFAPHIDWRGFTEQDFENLQADKKFDPQYRFNREFYAGDLKLQIRDCILYSNEKQITPWLLDNEMVSESRNIASTNLILSMGIIRRMTYEKFQDTIESHLRYLVRESECLTPAEKYALASRMEKPSPESWAREYLLDLISLSRQLIREGKVLSDIEQDWVKPNDRTNVLLFGGSEILMQKLDASLRKDAGIQKILFGNDKEVWKRWQQISTQRCSRTA